VIGQLKSTRMPPQRRWIFADGDVPIVALTPNSSDVPQTLKEGPKRRCMYKIGVKHRSQKE
jgi:hypothetical protein